MRLRRLNEPTAGPGRCATNWADRPSCFRSCAACGTAIMSRGELRRAYDLARRLVALAEEQGAPLRRALRAARSGSALFFLGRSCRCSSAAPDAGIAIDGAVEAWANTVRTLLLYTEHAGVVCRMYLGLGTVVPRLRRPRPREDRTLALDLGRRLAHAPQPRLRPELRRGVCTPSDASSMPREHEPRRRSRSRASITCRSVARVSRTMCRGFALVGLGQRDGGDPHSFAPA